MKKNKTYKYGILRKMHYSRQKIKGFKLLKTDIYDFFSKPYSSLKAAFFTEASVILIFFLQFTRITPNFVTMLYAFLGLLSGIFLASNNNVLIMTSLVLIFFKGILDWTDGLLAKIKNMTSNLGDALDTWAGLVGYYSYLAGFGLYLFNEYQNKYFALTTLLVIFIKSIDLKNFTFLVIGLKIFKEKNNKNILKSINFENKSNNTYKAHGLIKLKKFILEALDDSRARVMDIIVVLIFIDHFYKSLFFLPYIFYFITLKCFLIFTVGIYVTYFKNYVFKK
tara:strand:+ start:834 stop:1673 length:840 start_codon:yes stop_codon:yes gene_type:complete